MIERNIIIGLITSTNYLKQIRDIWNINNLESPTAKRIATWCWEYFIKFNKAPGRNIESIFYEKSKSSKFPKDIAEEIEEDILPGLSKEYENGEFNLQYLFEETEKYFNKRYLQLHNETIQALIDDDKTEEAEKLIQEFKPLGIVSKKLNKFIITVNQIRKKERPRPILFMKPWLRGGQTTIIYGGYGSGKSLLSISIAYVLGVKDYDNIECEIGPWQPYHRTGCLYIDGELGELEMEERIKQFEWLGQQLPEYRLRVFSIPEYQLATEDIFYLSNRGNQQKIIKWLIEHPTYKLVVLDSASTLFGLVEENDNSEWNTKINPLLRDLRALGVACILLHHAGKDNKKGLRGASAMGAMAHNIFRLIDHEQKSIDKGEAWFILKKDKQRAAGFSFKTFALKYTQNEDQTETSWKVTKITEEY